MCKEAGNRALTGKDFHAAHDSYTEGIRLIAERSELPENKSLEQDLHRNRSHVRLALGRYEGAVEDAMAALTHISDEKHQKLDAKAYFRASSALYELKLYYRAAVSIRHELELFPGDIDAQIRLERVQCRLREQEQGSYDIERIQKSISKKPHVDAADSIVNTVIKTSGPERGRGLFATRSLKTGDLVMAETAFCSVWSHEHNSLVAYECDARSPDEIHPGLSGLWRSAVNEVEKNPSREKISWDSTENTAALTLKSIKSTVSRWSILSRCMISSPATRSLCSVHPVQVARRTGTATATLASFAALLFEPFMRPKLPYILSRRSCLRPRQQTYCRR
jgi:tetratricopeptide (TPR) repeat protein